jgi:hypothetical protein
MQDKKMKSLPTLSRTAQVPVSGMVHASALLVVFQHFRGFRGFGNEIL